MSDQSATKVIQTATLETGQVKEVKEVKEESAIRRFC